MGRRRGDLRSILGMGKGKHKDMSGNVYLSLIFFFDFIEETSKLISLLGIYPSQFVDQIRISAQERQMV